MNVDLPTLTIGGAVAVGANGFSKPWGTYSEFVEEVELVTGTGEIRTVHKERDGDLWRAVGMQPGTIRHFHQDHARASSRTSMCESSIEKLDMRQAIGRRPPRSFEAHDYAQYFWFLSTGK